MTGKHNDVAVSRDHEMLALFWMMLAASVTMSFHRIPCVKSSTEKISL